MATCEQTAGPPSKARLLVSVRSAEEAQAALAGGADLIDIKDPDRGSLGCAVDQWPAILSELPADVPLSAALGELSDWRDTELPVIPDRIGWVKFGLAGQATGDWRREWATVCRRLSGMVQPVIVAYADWGQCQAPPLEEVCRFARHHVGALLLDTFDKRAGTLWDHLTEHQLAKISRSCRQRSCTFAVAGSLTGDSLRRSAECGCDWVAVRGAACRSGRHGTVDASLVQSLRNSLAVGSRHDKTSSPIA